MNMSINVLFLFIILFKGEVKKKKKKKGISKLIIVFPNNVIFNIN